MANVDLTLKITNPAVYNNLTSWQKNGMNINVKLASSGAGSIYGKLDQWQKNGIGIKLNFTPNLNNVAKLRSDISNAIGNVSVGINPRLNNANQLKQQITQAIGSISINVSIGNLAALSNQIAQLFAGLGLQTNQPTPRQPGGQAVLRRLGRIYTRQLQDDPNGPDPALTNVPTALTALSTQPGVPGILSREAVRDIIRKRAAIDRQRAKANAEFREKGLLSIALNGPDQAAREFEEEKGLRRGTINTRGVGRFSFDPTRIFRPAAFREVAISGAVGGIGGLVGGAIGASALGSPGVYGGATIGQAVVGSAIASFQKLYEALAKASSAGLELEKNIIGISAALSTGSKVFTLGGSEAGDLESLRFQRARSESLLTGTRKELSPLGVNQKQQSEILRGIISGSAEGGLNFSDSQLIKLAKIIGGTESLFNEDLLERDAANINNISDLFAGAATVGRSELGVQFRRVLPQLNAARASGNEDEFVRILEKFASGVKTLELSTDSAAVAFRKYNAITQELETTFGAAFNKALVPALNSINQALSKEGVSKALEELGTDIGRIAESLIKFGAVNITGIVNFFNFLVAASERASKNVPTNPLDQGKAVFDFIRNNADNAVNIGDFFGRQLGIRSLAAKISGRPITGDAGLIKPTDFSTPKRFVSKPNEQTFEEFFSKNKSNIDSGTLLGRFQLEQGELLSNPNISNRVKSAQFARLEARQGREQALTGIDQETRSGRLQSQLLSLEGQLDEGKITPEVFAAQKNRLNQAFSISQTLAGTNTNTLGGGLLGNVLGLQQKVNAGDITGAVGQQQASQAILKATEDLVNSFYGLQKSIQDSKLALEDNARIHTELNITLEEQKKQLTEIAKSRELEGLQGIDKLYALGDQIREAGGTVPILANNIGGELGQQFSLFNSPEDKQRRQREILERQFTETAKGLDTKRFNNQTILQQSQLFRQAEGTFLEREQTGPDGVRTRLAESQASQQILDFAAQFGKDQADKAFGKDSVRSAVKFFGDEGEKILKGEGGGKGDSFSRALEKVFGNKSEYYASMRKANADGFKDAFKEID